MLPRNNRSRWILIFLATPFAIFNKKSISFIAIHFIWSFSFEDLRGWDIEIIILIDVWNRLYWNLYTLDLHEILVLAVIFKTIIVISQKTSWEILQISQDSTRVLFEGLQCIPLRFHCSLSFFANLVGWGILCLK